MELEIEDEQTYMHRSRPGAGLSTAEINARIDQAEICHSFARLDEAKFDVGECECHHGTPPRLTLMDNGGYP